MHDSPAGDPEQVAGWLGAMPEERFRVVVADDAHNRLDGEAAAGLRHPKVRHRWLAMIRILLADVNTQLAGKQGDRSPDTEVWRTRALHWQGRLLTRRAEVRRLLQPGPGDREASLAARRARGEAGEVAVARLIDAHRAEFNGYLAEELELQTLPGGS